MDLCEFWVLAQKTLYAFQMKIRGYITGNVGGGYCIVII